MSYSHAAWSCLKGWTREGAAGVLITIVLQHQSSRSQQGGPGVDGNLITNGETGADDAAGVQGVAKQGRGAGFACLTLPSLA